MIRKIGADYTTYLEDMDYKDFAVVDPPWDYDDKNRPAIRNNLVYQRWDNRAGLVALFSMLKSNYLFLWCTNAMLKEVFLVDHGDFVYKTAITWIKTTKNGLLAYGLGNYFRNCTEQLLVFAKQGVFPLRTSIRTCFFAEMQTGTKKPRDFEIQLIRTLVEKGLKNGVYLFSGPDVDSFANVPQLQLDCVDILFRKRVSI